MRSILEVFFISSSYQVFGFRWDIATMTIRRIVFDLSSQMPGEAPTQIAAPKCAYCKANLEETHAEFVEGREDKEFGSIITKMFHWCPYCHTLLGITDY